MAEIITTANKKNLKTTILTIGNMFDIEKLATKDPQLFNELSNKYPLKSEKIYILQCIKQEVVAAAEADTKVEADTNTDTKVEAPTDAIKDNQDDIRNYAYINGKWDTEKLLKLSSQKETYTITYKDLNINCEAHMLTLNGKNYVLEGNYDENGNYRYNAPYLTDKDYLLEVKYEYFPKSNTEDYNGHLDFIIKNELRKGTGSVDGKLRIYYGYKHNILTEKFIKNTYGECGGWSGPGINSLEYNSKGIEINIKLTGDTVKLNWNQVINTIKLMIEDNTYLTDDELKEYNANSDSYKPICNEIVNDEINQADEANNSHIDEIDKVDKIDEIDEPLVPDLTEEEMKKINGFPEDFKPLYGYEEQLTIKYDYDRVIEDIQIKDIIPKLDGDMVEGYYYDYEILSTNNEIHTPGQVLRMSEQFLIDHEELDK